MRATSTERRLRRARLSSTLGAIAELVDDTFHRDPTGNGALVRVVDAPDGSTDEIEIGLKPLDGDHPLTTLGGVLVPASWDAIGVVVTGRAWHLDADDEPTPVTSTYLCDRRGASAGVLREGETVTQVPGPAEGTVPDVLRRSLGLPTAPPPTTTSVLFALAWLDAIVERCGTGRAPSWSVVAGLHPAVADAASREPAALASAARAHGERWTWTELRRAPGVLPLPGGLLADDVAAWMDDGMYARWALGAYPGARDLASAISALLPEATAERVLQTLAASISSGGPAPQR